VGLGLFRGWVGLGWDLFDGVEVGVGGNDNMYTMIKIHGGFLFYLYIYLKFELFMGVVVLQLFILLLFSFFVILSI